MDDGTEAAHGAVRQRDLAAMAASNVPGDGKPEASAALVEIARGVEPVEGAEDFLELCGRNAFTVIIDKNVDAAYFYLKNCAVTA